VAACAPSGNSRQSHPRARRRLGSAPIRITALLLVLILPTHCSLEDTDARASRHAAERYLSALAAHDADALRDQATCALYAEAAQGAMILRAEPVQSITRAALDSLAEAASDAEREGEAAWSRAVEEDADSLWLRSRALSRRAALYRNALAAAARSDESARGTAHRAGLAAPPASARLLTCRMRVRIRWGGLLVGPDPVDRVHVLRALAAPGGRWIVFSIYQREDDPPN